MDSRSFFFFVFFVYSSLKGRTRRSRTDQKEAKARKTRHDGRNRTSDTGIAATPTKSRSTAATTAVRAGTSDFSASSLAERRQRSGLAPGAIDPSNPLGRRARELRGRRAYLKNFWYAVALSEEVAEGGEGRRPLGVTALGRRLALFRDAGDGGRVRAVSDVCPHRGAPLHRGWVSDEIEVGAGDAGAGAGGGRRRSCVVCPYHGWAFDGEGVLRDVPAAEHADEWPRRQLVESYPIVEKGGFVWLFYGEGKVFYVFFSSTR